MAAALIAAAPASAAPQKAADWSRTVVASPDGGFRMGNPKAAVKLVEYGSLTCPSCRNFAETASAPLMAKVKSGKVSFEFRNFVLNGIDVAASLVARCGGAASFFPVLDKLYATQPDWLGRISGLSAAEKDRLTALPSSQRLVAIARAAGFQKLAAEHGLPVAEADKCLADQAGFERLGKLHEGGTALGVHGTPTFLINGATVEAHDWPSLEPLIKRAGG
ncbi:MAG TPA: thioredoxin domain-containing protein [Sphingomicrobium sp.]|nr:thioredoxin domain-containing protein [Sphingomicrobium sp.]